MDERTLDLLDPGGGCRLLGANEKFGSTGSWRGVQAEILLPLARMFVNTVLVADLII